MGNVNADCGESGPGDKPGFIVRCLVMCWGSIGLKLVFVSISDVRVRVTYMFTVM